MKHTAIAKLMSGLFLLATVPPATAGGISDAYGSVAPPQMVASNEVYTFATPPRDKNAGANDEYQPIVELLSKATGKKFNYRHPDNWLEYQAEMRKGDYDVIFDGPHFVGWRIRQIGHTPLLKLPQPHVWVVITKQGSPITSVKELAGHPVCVHAPPNFGTLTLLSLFDNPARQPYMREIKGWNSAFNGVVSGKCEATILPSTNLKTLDPEMKLTKILFEHAPYPNQAFTSGPRITPDMQAKIIKALQSEEGKQATRLLRDKFCKGRDLVPATKEEYGDVALVLKNYWGFEF